MFIYIAPILNAYIDTADRRNFARFLVCFFVFQTIYSWISDAAFFFESGYSTMSFIGLYLLSRYFRLYQPVFTRKGRLRYLFIYFLVVILLTFTAYVAVINNCNFILDKIYSYVNPLVIISSLSLLLFFSKIYIKSSLINWIGASCFAVFLFHTNPNVCLQYFVPTVKYIVQENSEYAALLYIFIFLLFVFVISIILDQIRIFLWSKICKYF